MAKRKCSICGKSGHNAATCPKKTKKVSQTKQRKKLEAFLWKHTHSDYKSRLRGKKSVLRLNPNTQYTELVPIESLSDSELHRLARYYR